MLLDRGDANDDVYLSGKQYEKAWHVRSSRVRHARIWSRAGAARWGQRRAHAAAVATGEAGTRARLAALGLRAAEQRGNRLGSAAARGQWRAGCSRGGG
jgi:hypothetical protein